MKSDLETILKEQVTELKELCKLKDARIEMLKYELMIEQSKNATWIASPVYHPPIYPGTYPVMSDLTTRDE